jgi:hypothetical protein
MRTDLRRREVVFAIYATIIGICGLTFLLFGPVYLWQTNGSHGETISVRTGLAMNPHGDVIPLPLQLTLPFVISIGCLLLLSLGAILHNRGVALGRWIVWGATALLLVIVIIAALSNANSFGQISLFGQSLIFAQYLWIALLPALALTMFTSWMATRDTSQSPASVVEEQDDD